MRRKLNYLGMLGLATTILSIIPSLSWLNVVSLVILLYLYNKLDQLSLGLKLMKFTVWSTALAIPLGLVLFYCLQQSKDILIVGLVIVFLLVLFLAYINYRVAEMLFTVAQKTNNKHFQTSAKLTKMGAYTLPCLVGFIFIVIAQIFFFLGCITYKGIPIVAIEK